MTTAQERTLHKNVDVAYRSFGPDGGGVLLHVPSGNYHRLNATGCLVWDLIDGVTSPGEIGRRLSASTSGAPSAADVERSVSDLLDALEERGLVRAR